MNALQYLTASQLVSHMCLVISLNEKQEIVALEIFQHYLDKVYFKVRTECTNQLLFYVGGEGGVEKSQVIKAIATGLQMLNCQQDLHVIAPMGAVADNIDGSIIHTALNMSVLNGKGCQK